MSEFKRSGKFFVYILRCSDKSFYTGYTPNLSRRLRLHNAGKGAKYTRSRRPVKLVYQEKFKYFKPAFAREREIKAYTRERKEALVKS